MEENASKRSLQTDQSMDDAKRILGRFAVGDLHVEGRSVTAPISGGAQTLTEALRALDAAGVELRDVGLRRPTLDDVFLSLTGRMTQAEDQTGPDVAVSQPVAS